MAAAPPQESLGLGLLGCGLSDRQRTRLHPPPPPRGCALWKAGPPGADTPGIRVLRLRGAGGQTRASQSVAPALQLPNCVSLPITSLPSTHWPSSRVWDPDAACALGGSGHGLAGGFTLRLWMADSPQLSPGRSAGKNWGTRDASLSPASYRTLSSILFRREVSGSGRSTSVWDRGMHSWNGKNFVLPRNSRDICFNHLSDFCLLLIHYRV